MPQMGVSVAEGTIVAWRVEVGDRIEAEQTICEISTDKIDTEVPAPVGGVVTEILVGVDQTVDVGVVLARIATGDASAADEPTATGDAPVTEEAPSAPASQPSPDRPAAGRRYSPVVQRIAAEHDIDLSAVSGTGRGGRVRKQDVLALVDGNGAEPPLHIESPYRPEPPRPAAPAEGAGLPRMRRQ